MSYSGGGLGVNTPLFQGVSPLTLTTTRTASAPTPGRSMGFSGEQGRLNALKIVVRPYLVALQQAALSTSLTLAERAQLAARFGLARKLAAALDAVRPHSGGWVRSDIDKLRVIATSGDLPTARDIELLAKSGNTVAWQYARQIAQAWNELKSSLAGSGWWSAAPGAAPSILGARIVTGNLSIDRSTGQAADAARAAELAHEEAEAARQRSDTEAAIAAARAEAEAAAATAAALQNAVAEAQATANEQTGALQAALQQAEAAAAEAAQRAQAELDSARKRGSLWIWGLAALAVGGVGYAVLRK